MTLHGWDASDFDWNRGLMDLGAAKRDGITFFTHKATENTNVKHLHFGEAMVRARDAGIPFLGAYHVVRSPRNAQAEVDYFLNYVDRSFPEWRTFKGFFIQVDMEKWPYDSVPAIEGEDFADLTEAQTGKTAIIYASKGQYGNDLAGTSHHLWNANYPLNYQAGPYRDLYARAGGDSGPGWASYSGREPQIWQFTSSADIGRQPTCDANAFRGTESDFARMIMGSNPKTGEDTVITFVRGLGDPTVWRAEGGIRTAIPSEQHLADIRYQSGQGAIAPLANGGQVMEVGNLDAFGIAYPPSAQPSGTLSYAQLADLEAKLSAKLPTAADIVAALVAQASKPTV